ncbi:MAG TPA: hypothetical protein QGF58_12165 [Myxococcota bacterium]|nr:hypothetical protein [Myxococcota bacterium]
MTLLLLSCTNTMKATRDAPFSLGSLKTALFAESQWSTPEAGTGSATLLLVDDSDYTCEDLEAELAGTTEQRDSITWTASGAVVDVQWWNNTGENIGWVGEYFQGAYGYGGYYYYDYSDEDDQQRSVDRRTMASAVFADERIWQSSYLLGRLEITSGDVQLVTGTIDTEWWRARFEAHNCGQIGEGD